MQRLLTFEKLVALGYVNNRVTLARRIRRGEFPAPIRVGSRNVAWLKDEVDAWELERLAERTHRALRDTAANTHRTRTATQHETQGPTQPRRTRHA